MSIHRDTTNQRDYNMDKYVCFDCKKSFKRKTETEIGLKTQKQLAKCPECNQTSFRLGYKFRAPKANDSNSWHSLKVLEKVGELDFEVGATTPINLPKSNKELKNYLELLSERYSCQIDKWSRADYDSSVSEQIKIFSNQLVIIQKELKNLKK